MTPSFLFFRNLRLILASHMTPTEKGGGFIRNPIPCGRRPQPISAIRPGTCPASGGARPSPPGGGRAASIAKMYILALAGARPWTPMPPSSGNSGRLPQRGDVCAASKHHLHIELTPAQYELLCQQAKACGLSKRLFLVRLIEGQPVRARPGQAIK